MDIYSDIKYTISERRTILFRKGIGCDACRGGKKGAEVVDEMDYKVINAKLLLSAEEGAVMEASAVKLARLTADIIANQFE